MKVRRTALATLVRVLMFGAVAAALGASAPRDRFDRVVIDPGHGGQDAGARGARGLAEKDVVLDVALRLAEELRDRGLHVVLTRERDEFVPLEARTALANDTRADLFLSIHANASRSGAPRGIETYFASLEASDAAAGQLARLENGAFAVGAAAPVGADPLLALLGDLIATEQLAESNEFAKLARAELARLDGAPSRGVRQAPFVVLLGVQMPASLVEIGFITNSQDEGALRTRRRRDAIAQALARAVTAFGRRFDARHGASAGPLAGAVGGGGR